MIKRFITVCIMCICWMMAHGQNNTIVKKVAVSNDGTMGLDTNKLAIDEKGDRLRFYQYEKLLRSGKYAISSRGPNSPLLNEYRLEKNDDQRSLQIYGMIKNQVAIKSAMLQEGSKLSIEPLAHLIKPEEFEGKAVVLIFFTTDCEQCNMGLNGLDTFFKQVYDPKKMIIVAINNRSKEETYDQLKLTPLPNTIIVYDAYKIKDAYWITTTNAFVVTDKNHIIQFATSGAGGIIDAVLKNKITTVLNQ